MNDGVRVKRRMQPVIHTFIQCFWVIFRVALLFQILMKLTAHNDEMSQTVIQQQSNKYMQSLWKLANFIKSLH